MESYKRKAAAKSIEIRSRRLKHIKRLLTFLYWFIPCIFIVFCILILYKYDIYPMSYIRESNESNLVVEEYDLVVEDNDMVVKETDSVVKETNSADEDGIIQSHGGSMVDGQKNQIQYSIVQEPLETNESDSKEIPQTETATKKYEGKKIYLTFDDGPTKVTEKILDILKEYEVKATFFVIGKTDEFSLSMYQRIVDEGHELGIHSYTHDYNSIYKSVEDFQKDFTKLRNLLYDTTGYLPNLYRFPGGSATLVGKNIFKDLVKFLNEEHIIYYDWNVVNGDATGQLFTVQQLIDNTIRGINSHEESIVLMHDSNTKSSTATALIELLDILINNGATILPLDKTVEPIQQLKLHSR